MQAKALTDEVSGLQTEVSRIEAINAAISSNPDLVSVMMNSIATQGNNVIDLNSLDYDGTTGALQIIAIADNEKEAARYIERLKSTGYFTQVEYTGYAEILTQTSTTTTTTSTTKGYGFAAVAYLKAGNSQ